LPATALRATIEGRSAVPKGSAENVRSSVLARPAEERKLVVKLRLMRMGKTKQPTYRVVAADARSPRNGRFIEIVGHYNPRT